MRWCNRWALIAVANYMFCQDMVLHVGDCTIPIYDDTFMTDMVCTTDLWDTLIAIREGTFVPDPAAIPHPDG